MNLIFYHILNLVDFLLVISIGIALVSILLYFLSNKFNIKFINVYGFFSSIDDISLIMLSSSILKEIKLIFCIMKLYDFSIIYLYIFVIFSFTYAFFSFKVWIFTKEVIISGIEYLIIFLLSLLVSFMQEVKYLEIIEYYLWILSAILISCSIYFFVRNLSTIITRDKHVRRNLIVK